MVKQITLLSLFLISSLALTAQTLVHYWNFNNSTDQTTLLTPTSNLVPGAAIAHIAGGISAIQAASNTGQGFDVTNPNARNGDAALTHLRFNDPIGGGLLFSLPTTGFQQVVVSYATRRSGSGAGNQLVYYTTNGTDFDSLTVIEPANGDPTLQTLDFSDIPAVNDNPDFAIRITFEAGAGGTVGNNRFDNFTVDAFPSGSDVFPPTVAFFPLSGTVDVSTSINPTITFSEDVRLVSDAAITDGDIPTLIDMRLDDAAGAPVAFSGTIAGRVITITPDAALANGQTYYFALNANVVEDTSNNVVAAVQSATFTTIAPQTQFQAGDLVPVAYRMNASGGQDEVAFLTFVNILPGTKINFTDTKFTDNPQPQCPGGLTWTSPNQLIPAGSVFVIQNDAGAASTGTVTGSTFGLSSGGDQVIVYTGTPADPSYITALSSNAWVSSPHTACGGSLSLIPAGLEDGVSAINLSTAPGNTGGNTVNGYYSGTQTGTNAELRASILNSANWNGIGGATPLQAWPNWNFPGPPQVTSALVTSNSTIQLVFNNDLDAASASDLANYTGIVDLANASVTNNGTAQDTVTLTYASPFVLGNTYTLTVAGVVDSENRVMLSPFNFTFEYVTKIKFNNRFTSVSEDGGSATFSLTVENPSPGATVDLVFKTGIFSTATDADVTFATTTLDASSTTSILLEIPIVDDAEGEQDEYFVLALENANGITVDGNPFYTVYIRDNDRKAPVGTKSIELEFTSRYSVPNPAGELGVAEIVAYDPASKRLFTVSTALQLFDIIDFSNPTAPALISQVDVSSYGGGITSIAVKNGIVAACLTALTTEQDNGSVVFFDVNGVFQNSVTVGALPDMITFTPDGNTVLTANEGQPNDAYTIDPEGSVSMIDISGGIVGLTQANVTNVTFNAFDAQADDLKAQGVRILFAASTVSQDFEPEYITVAADNLTAWVVLQENNANVTQTICDGQFINLDAGAGFTTYEWSTGATTQGIQVTTAGAYGVLVSAANGCFGSDAVEVVVNPTPSVNIGANQTICEGETASLSAGGGFTTYAWNTGATGQSINVTTTGTYSVVVSNSFGCTDQDAATVFVNPAPVLDLGPDTIVYEPNSYLLDAGAGFNQTYLWSNGSTSQTLTVTTDGTYSVTVTSGNGCESTDEVTVNFQPNAVNEPTLAGQLNLFPNPTSGWVNLAFSEFEAGAYSVGVYDVVGRLLLAQNIDIQAALQTTKLDLNAFSKGTYFVKVGSEKGVLVRRVTVQ